MTELLPDHQDPWWLLARAVEREAALEARLREVEAERDAQRLFIDSHTQSWFDANKRAENSEAERDAYKADAEALIAAKAIWVDRVAELEAALAPLLANSFTWHPRSEAEQASFDAAMETIRLGRAALETRRR